MKPPSTYMYFQEFTYKSAILKILTQCIQPVRQFKHFVQEKCTKLFLSFDHSSLDQLTGDGGQELQKDTVFLR